MVFGRLFHFCDLKIGFLHLIQRKSYKVHFRYFMFFCLFFPLPVRKSLAKKQGESWNFKIMMYVKWLAIKVDNKFSYILIKYVIKTYHFQIINVNIPSIIIPKMSMNKTLSSVMGTYSFSMLVLKEIVTLWKISDT